MTHWTQNPNERKMNKKRKGEVFGLYLEGLCLFSIPLLYIYIYAYARRWDTLFMCLDSCVYIGLMEDREMFYLFVRYSFVVRRLINIKGRSLDKNNGSFPILLEKG